jgi:D-aspartate ligase
MMAEHGVTFPQGSQSSPHGASGASASASGTPVVVLGGSLNALGVVRSLKVGKMPVIVLETTRRCPAAWSKGVQFRRIPTHEGPELVATLISIGRQLGNRPVLILTSDPSVNCVSESRAQLEGLFRITLPSPEMVRDLGDKILFQQLAEREGFSVPRSLCVGEQAELAQLDGLTPPFIAKPADKRLVLNGVAERAVRAETLEQAKAEGAKLLQNAGRIVFQEWIPGGDTEIYFTLFSCADDGTITGLFAGRKLRCTPPAIGNTAVCVAAPPELAADLIGPTQAFIARVGYKGLGSLEFKRHQRTGRFLMIEPTVGRTDWQEEIATLCGVNLPLMSYCSALGRTPPAADNPTAKLAWRSSVGFGAPLDAGVRAVDGYFRWTDPMPALFYYGFERGVQRLWRKLMGRAS